MTARQGGGSQIAAFKEHAGSIVARHRIKALPESGPRAALAWSILRGVPCIIREFGDQPLEGLRIFFGYLRDRFTGAIQIAPDRNGRPVLKGNMHDQLRIDVFESVLA